jgi:hypothetical protein
MIGQFVLVRTYSAGVHMGILASQNGKEITLTDARRLWRWRGANSLSEVSQKGVAQEWTRISEAVPLIALTEAVEIIPCSATARETLVTSRWAP